MYNPETVMQKKSNDILLKLKGIGIKNVYIDPPETLIMKYPCCRVRVQGGRARYADNGTHIFTPSWELIYISYEPDDQKMIDIMQTFSRITFQRHYTADSLHHYSYTLYY